MIKIRSPTLLNIFHLSKHDFSKQGALMKNFLISGFFVLFSVTLFQGCRSGAEIFAAGTEGKNTGLDGYLMYGTIDTADTTGGLPVGKLIIGRVVYKSRKVAIPADQKVPHTGNFKSTRTKTLFGTEEHIVEYDFTAGNDAEAEAASARLEQLKKETSSANW